MVAFDDASDAFAAVAVFAAGRLAFPAGVDAVAVAEVLTVGAPRAHGAAEGEIADQAVVPAHGAVALAVSAV